MDDVFDSAEAALNSGDIETVRQLLTPLAERGVARAQLFLGTALSLERDPASLQEAERWLKLRADDGDGHAAHNLGTLYLRLDQRELANTCFQLAVDTGVEASVCSDPYWWKRW